MALAPDLVMYNIFAFVSVGRFGGLFELSGFSFASSLLSDGYVSIR